MKLHLPSGLRKALFACIATIAAHSVPVTVAAGTLSTSGALISFLLSQQAGAEEGDGDEFMPLALPDGWENAETVSTGAGFETWVQDTSKNVSGGKIVLEYAESGTGFYFGPKRSITILADVCIGSGGLNINNGYSDMGDIIFTGALLGSGNFRYIGSPTNQHWLFRGDMSQYTGNLEITGGNNQNQLKFQGITSGTGTITINASKGTLYVDGATMQNSAINVENMEVSTYESTALSTFKVADIDVTGTLTINAGATVVFDAYQATNVSSVDIAALVLNGSMTVKNGVTMNITGGLSGNGTVNMDGGTLTLGGATTISALTLGNNSHLKSDSDLSLSSVTGTGNITMTAANLTLTGDSSFGALTIEGNGSLNYGNHTLTLASLSMDSGIDISGGTLTVNTTVNTQTLQLSNGTLNVEGTLSLRGDYTQRGGEATINILSTVGNVEAAEGILTIVSSLTAGTLAVNNATVKVNDLHITNALHMVTGANGSLTAESITLSNRAILYYDGYGDDDSKMIDLSTANDLEADAVYVNSFDFTYEQRKEGVNLGLKVGNFSKENIYANGYEPGDFELEERDGYWYLVSEKTPGVDTTAPGVWDANWGQEEYMDRPNSSETAPHVESSDNALYLSDKRDLHTITAFDKKAVWAQLNEHSLPLKANVFGGCANQEEGTVENDLWLDVIGGIYGNIVGGNDASNSGGSKLDYKGSTHIQLRKAGSAKVIVNNVIGGNFKDGGGTKDGGSSFDATRRDGTLGGSFISIGAGVEVGGAVVGGSVFTHNRPADFIGNSHIFIYEALRADDSVHLGQSEDTQVVVGGNIVSWNVVSTHTFGGDSNISISLKDSLSKSFEKSVTGGDFISNGGSSNNGGKLTHAGNSRVSITGAAGVVFAERITGGSYSYSGSDLIIEGDTEVRIDSGTYNNLVTAGSASGSFKQEADNHQAKAANLEIEGSTHLTISGGTFNGHETVLTIVNELDTLGALAVVGGNHAFMHSVGANGTTGHSSITGGTNVTITGGMFNGHIVAGSVEQGVNPANSKIGYVKLGDVHLKMTGGTMAKGAKVVGGHLLQLPTTSAATDGVLFSLGNIELTIGGKASVGDVIGGSWTHRLDVEDATLKQDSISISLSDHAVVRGDVYAGGIQGGSTSLTTGDVSVSIASGVRFEKEDGAPTIISAGYLSTKEGLADNAFASYYDDGGNASTVAGERKLHLADSADYGDHLANAWLVGFEDILLKKDTKATVGAIFNDEELVNISGSGADKGEASQITMYGELINVLDAEGNKQSRVNNSALHLSNGVTLHVLASRSGKNTSYLAGVTAEGGSNMIIDFAQASGNDTLLVGTDISLDGGALTLNFNATEAMLTRALIQRQPQDIARYDAGNGSVLKMQGTTLTINVQAVESSLLTGKEVRLLIADGIEASEVKYVLNEDTLANLEKWFDSTPTVEVDGDLLLLGGKTVSPSTAVYHQKRTLTENGRAGAAMLDNLYTTLNPEWSDAGGDRTRLLNELERKFARNEIQEADTAMAAAAGASMAMLGQALAEDVDRQLRAIRNRTTTMGLNSDYNYDDLPRLQFWVNAEIDSRKMQSQDTAAGYRINSWGGTVGVAADLSATSTVGLALTAMYGDIETYSPDKLKGDMVTSYLSGFWRTASGAWNHTLVATVGLASVDAQRTVDYGSGSYSTESSPTGYAVGLMYEIGYSIPLNAEASAVIQPVANVSFRHSEIRGFSESGSDAGLEVEGMKHNTLILAGGVRAQALVGSEFFNSASILEGRVMLKGYSGDKSSSAQTAFQGASYKGTVKGREMGSIGVEIGAGLTLPVGEDQIFADFSAELRSAETNFNAAIGYKVDF